MLVSVTCLQPVELNDGSIGADFEMRESLSSFLKDSKASTVWMCLSSFFDWTWWFSMTVFECVVDVCSVGPSKNLRLFGPDKEKY